VELAGLAETADVPTAVASALQIPQRAGTPEVDRIVEALAGRKMLLVLDTASTCSTASPSR
jgi:predicted ATPase